MEINLNVIQVLPVESGVGKASGKSWSKQMVIAETIDQYPKKVALTIFNPGQNVATPNVGDHITASIDVESRSFIGKDGVERWSTDVKCWKIVPYDPTANVPAFAQPMQQQPMQQPQQQAYQPQGVMQGQYAQASQYAQQQAPQYAPPAQSQYAAQAPMPDSNLPF